MSENKDSNRKSHSLQELDKGVTAPKFERPEGSKDNSEKITGKDVVGCGIGLWTIILTLVGIGFLIAAAMG